MKLEIEGVRERGVLEKERIVFRAKSDLEIGDFAILKVIAREGQATAAVRSAYWFPNKSVRAGDTIVLFTKAGISSDKPLSGGSTSHFFYWSSSEPIWSKSDDGVVILFAPEWDFRLANAPEQGQLEFDSSENAV